MRHRFLIVVAALVALIASAAVASNPSLKPMVLRLNDLPASFAQDYSRAVPRGAGAPPGYVSGWEVEFIGLVKPDNVAIVHSQVSRYRTAAQAHASILDSFKGAANLKGVKRISIGRPIGSDTRGFSYQTEYQGNPVTMCVVVWREANVKASVQVGMMTRTESSLGASARQAAQLAVKQDAHMRSALR